MELRESIDQSYVAKGFSQEELELLHGIARTQTFEDGEEILRQYEPCRDLLILATGRAHILTVVGEPIGLVRPGMPMGEVSFMDGRRRSGTAVACGRCEVVVLPADSLLKLLEDHPQMAVKALWNIGAVLCTRLRGANNNLAALMALEESDSGFPRR